MIAICEFSSFSFQCVSIDLSDIRIHEICMRFTQLISARTFMLRIANIFTRLRIRLLDIAEKNDPVPIARRQSRFPNIFLKL